MRLSGEILFQQPANMSEVALQLEHSVEADVSPAFAWSFRTDVANWNDPLAEFTLEGPFAAGSEAGPG